MIKEIEAYDLKELVDKLNENNVHNENILIIIPPRVESPSWKCAYEKKEEE